VMAIESDLESLVAQLSKRLDVAEKELQRLEDDEEIKSLVNKYGTLPSSVAYVGYYMDKQLFKQVTLLFSTREDVRGYCHGGIWVGKAGIERFYVCR
jgi:hypothetical protein